MIKAASWPIHLADVACQNSLQVHNVTRERENKREHPQEEHYLCVISGSTANWASQKKNTNSLNDSKDFLWDWNIPVYIEIQSICTEA